MRIASLHPSSLLLHPSSNPQSLVPNPCRRPGGFTLVEMLVVITIVMVLMAAATTIFKPDDSRQVREASRALHLYLGTARNRAMETGRPCGVVFHRLQSAGATAASMDIDQCEVPPTYAGESEDATLQVRQLQATIPAWSGTKDYLPGELVSYSSANYLCIQGNKGQTPAALSAYWTTSFSAVEATDPNGTFLRSLIHVGDSIQLNWQGPWYSVAVDPLAGPLIIAACDTRQGQLVPWDNAAKPVPYRIRRVPMTPTTIVKGGASSLQLPVGSVVDLGWSGPGTGIFNAAGTSVTILFSPNGSVECYYEGTARRDAVEPIFLLVGKRERIEPQAFDATNPDTYANWQDLKNYWVTVNPQTGLVTTSEMAVPVDPNPSVGVPQSRAIAAEGQGMGGR